MDQLKVLMLTRLFPSRAFPTNGTFCAERAKALSRRADVRVMVPTPWYPRNLPGPGTWRRWARVERQATGAAGVAVCYPRYLSLPKIATWLQGASMARSVRRSFGRFSDGWVPDVVHGHFAFPDGYAAVKLAGAIGRPALVTCHGSDLLQYPPLPLAGSMLRWSLRRADRVISVSSALRRRSVELGCPEGRAVFLPNGVDPTAFAVQDKADCRRRVGLPTAGPIAVCVGWLIDRKNQSVLIQALAEIRRRKGGAPLLVLVGEGPNRAKLARQARDQAVSDRVRFAGQRPYSEIPDWMGAADCLVVSSRYEGWATVYFEAMACGRPVVTSDVSSAKDAVCSYDYGVVVERSTPEAFAAALCEAIERPFDAAAIRAYAEGHSWDNWAKRWEDTARAAIAEHRSAGAAGEDE